MISHAEVHPPEGPGSRRWATALGLICPAAKFFGTTVHNRLLTFGIQARRVALAAAIALAGALYLADLTGMGLVGPDEPRYAAIGRAMAGSGDWITPRLWGQPWFEKPVLLYWMTASAFRLGMGPDLAPRLPVALLSLAFLAFFWWRLRSEWDTRVAFCSTAMLATSAGWLTYSHIAVTDLPLSVFFCAAVLLSIPWLARQERAGLTAAAACLGLAALAKGLVPLVLFLPLFAFGWRRLGDWLRPGPLLAFSICALPWYILCLMRNGSDFPRVLFVQQTFGRFASAALQHVQPPWFYIPISLLLLYPWFPILSFDAAGMDRFACPRPDRRGCLWICLLLRHAEQIAGVPAASASSRIHAGWNRTGAGETSCRCESYGRDRSIGEPSRLAACRAGDRPGRSRAWPPLHYNRAGRWRWSGSRPLQSSERRSLLPPGNTPSAQPRRWRESACCAFNSPLFPGSTPRRRRDLCGWPAIPDALNRTRAIRYTGCPTTRNGNFRPVLFRRQSIDFSDLLAAWTRAVCA